MNKKRVITASAVSVGVTGALALAGYLFNKKNLSLPAGATVVRDFDVKKYLGKWFEMARIDYRYEKDLDNVTAQYELKSNGTIKVVNKGYNFKKETWESKIGKAKFIEKKDEGRLKVSFFEPIYAAYNIIELDKDYQYALVVGNSTDYAWILSRTTTIPEDVKQKYLQAFKAIGGDPEKMVWINQDKHSKSHKAVGRLQKHK